MHTLLFETIKKYKNLKKNGLIQEIRYNSIMFNELNELTTFLHVDATISERLYCIINNIRIQPQCLCGKPLKFLKLNRGYLKSCASVECIHISRSNASKEANKNKDWNAIQIKMKQTSLDRYGYNNNFCKDSSSRLSYNNIMINKYGSKHALNNKDILLKQQNTTLLRHGTLNMLATDKVKTTMIEKYDTIYAMQNKDIQLKSSLKQKNTKIIPIIERLNNMNCEYISGLNSYDISFKCNKCNTIFTHQSKQTINGVYIINKSKKHNYVKSPCNICYPHETFRSNFEKEVQDCISSLYKKEIHINRQYLGKEVDIIIPELKLAIECNGLYWHSDLYKSKDYHKEKKIFIESKGYNLINIWEDDWNDETKFMIIMSRLAHKMNISVNKIYARKCIIKEVNGSETRKFLDTNHLQGYTASSINLGLYYNDNLVEICSFKKGRKGIGNINDFYELVRSSTILNTSVIGGFSKLIKYFIKNYSNKLYSFADCDWTSLKNSGYEKNGFKLLSYSSPGYVWADKIRHHRLNFTKQKLIEAGFDKNKTEDIIMRERKFLKIWNAGNLKYIYIKTQDGAII